MKNFFIGLLVGAGAILPGVSSSVFLVVFGLYEKIINSILHFFKDFKNNFLFLFPLAVGGALSILLFSKVLLFAYEKYYIYTSYVFLGFILGSIPSVIKQSSINKPNFYHILCFIFSLVFSTYLVLIEKENNYNISSFSYWYLILVGLFMSCGIIIPGVSKTAILIILGFYSTYLSSISTLNFTILFPLGIGLLLGSIFFMYIMSFLFSNFKSYTYSLILGFVISSCFVILPDFSFNLEHFIGIILCFSSFYFVKKFEKINNT